MNDVFRETEAVSSGVKQAQVDTCKRRMSKSEYQDLRRKKRNPRFKKTGKL